MQCLAGQYRLQSGCVSSPWVGTVCGDITINQGGAALYSSASLSYSAVLRLNIAADFPNDWFREVVCVGVDLRFAWYQYNAFSHASVVDTATCVYFIYLLLCSAKYRSTPRVPDFSVVQNLRWSHSLKVYTRPNSCVYGLIQATFSFHGFTRIQLFGRHNIFLTTNKVFRVKLHFLF